MSEVMEVMATDHTTTNDAIELTTYLKRKLASKLKEIEKDINKIADVIKGQDQIKRALRNDLCKECRDKSHEIFKLPLKSFSDVESQTMKSFLEADPSNNDKHYMKEDSTVISETEQKGEPLDSEKNTLQEDNAKMKQKLEEMKKKLEQSKETIDQLQEENGRLNDHRLTSKKDLRVVQDERDSYQTQLRSMQGEIDSLRKPVDGSLVRGITQDTTKTTSEQAKIVGKYSAFEQNVEKRLMENLASSNATGEQEFEQLILDVGKNQEQIRMSQPETEQFNSERNTLREENALMIQKHREMEMKLTQSHEDMGQLKEENRRLDADRDLRNSVIRSLKGEKEKQILYIKELQQEKQRQDENVDGLQAKLEDLESKLKKIQEENLVSEQRDRDDALKSMKMEKENTESQMKRVQDEMTKLQKDLDQLNTKMTETESELTKTQKENEHLRDCQSARADEMRSLRSEKDQIHSQMERVQKEQQQIQLKVDQQTEKMKQTDSELIKAQNENRKLTGTLATRADEMRSLKSEKDQIHSQMERVQKEKQQIQLKVDQQTEKMKQTDSELIKAQNENQKLTGTLGTTKERLQTLQKNHEILKSETITSQQENDKIRQTMDEKIMSLTDEKKKAQKENTFLKAECDKQKEELKQSKQQLEELKKPKKKRVVLGLRSGLNKPLVDSVTKILTKRLQERLDRSNLNLVVSFSQNPSEVTNGFQIVLCLNMSRVGTNILDSLKGMKVDRDVFVMVLHLTNKENLSSITPTSHRVAGSEVRQLGGILDMAFSSESGLYECDLNNAAVEKIASILRKCLIF